MCKKNYAQMKIIKYNKIFILEIILQNWNIEINVILTYMDRVTILDWNMTTKHV